jgi:hypothetical protein
MSTSTDIDRLLEETMGSIGAAAAKRDIAGISALTKKAAELEAMKKTISGIEEQLKGYQTPTSASPATAAQPPQPALAGDGKLRKLPIEVTQGMVNQNLLTLTEHVKRGRIQPGEELLVEAMPSGERFRTDLVENGNKLRERGAIARFYRDAGVRSGDYVVLVETASQRWALRKAEAGEYQSRRELLSW